MITGAIIGTLQSNSYGARAFAAADSVHLRNAYLPEFEFQFNYLLERLDHHAHALIRHRRRNRSAYFLGCQGVGIFTPFSHLLLIH